MWCWSLSILILARTYSVGPLLGWFGSTAVVDCVIMLLLDQIQCFCWNSLVTDVLCRFCSIRLKANGGFMVIVSNRYSYFKKYPISRWWLVSAGYIEGLEAGWVNLEKTGCKSVKALVLVHFLTKTRRNLFENIGAVFLNGFCSLVLTSYCWAHWVLR